MRGLCSEPFHRAYLVKTRENRVAGLCSRMLNRVGTRVSVSRVFSRRTRTCLFSYTFIYAADLMACVSTHCCLFLRAAEKDLLTATLVLVLVFRCCLLFPVDIMQS